MDKDMFSEVIERVDNWLNRHGENPSDYDIVYAVIGRMIQWQYERKSGMDVLASHELDRVAEIISAIRDRI